MSVIVIVDMRSNDYYAFIISHYNFILYLHKEDLLMNTRNLIKRIVGCGAIVLAITGFTAFASTQVDHYNQDQQECTKTEITYPTAGIVRVISEDVQEQALTVKANDVDIVRASLETAINESANSDDTASELEELKAENVRLQETINHLEKTIDQYKRDTDALTKKNRKLKKELENYESKDRQQESISNIKMTAKLDASDVRVLSGASPETLNCLLEGTWLEGYGQKFYDNEQKYGINALFSIGNAILETGWGGDSWLAKNKNNIYGLNMSRRFDSYNECIDYWFNLISDHYVGDGYISMGSIQGKYCPPNPNWDEKIVSIANRLRTKAGVTIE